jgi:hypothetical protein
LKTKERTSILTSIVELRIAYWLLSTRRENRGEIMKKVELILFMVIAILLGHLFLENRAIKKQLWSQQTELDKQKILVVSKETTILAKKNHTYRIKAKLVREGGTVVVIPLFQVHTGVVNGKSDDEPTSLHLVQHLSENNQKFFRLRTEIGPSWSWTPSWKQIHIDKKYDLGENEENMILEILFGRDVWRGSVESITNWQDIGKGKTKAGIIIEELKGITMNGEFGPQL